MGASLLALAKSIYYLRYVFVGPVDLGAICNDDP